MVSVSCSRTFAVWTASSARMLMRVKSSRRFGMAFPLMSWVRRSTTDDVVQRITNVRQHVIRPIIHIHFGETLPRPLQVENGARHCFRATAIAALGSERATITCFFS